MIKRKYVTLAITEYCNLACRYCYEHKKTTKIMDFKVAKEIIDREMDEDDEYSEVMFDFFGGEPFTEFSLIKQCFEYIMSKKTSKKFLCFAVTNGTLITEEVKAWLRKNKDYFWCGLSYDGTKEMQDFNRSNSSKDIDLSFFYELWPEQPIKMTISEYTLPNMAEGIIFLHEQGFKVSANLAFGLDWSSEENAMILERELGKLIEYYLDNPQIEPSTILNRNIAEITSEKCANFRWCGAGVHMHTYNIDGILYPCHFFMPITLGTEKSEKARQLDFSPSLKLHNEKCEKCPILQICQICYGASYQQFGDRKSRDENLCYLNQIIVRANAYFQWKRIEKYGIEKVAAESGCGERNMLDAISIIQELAI